MADWQTHFRQGLSLIAEEKFDESLLALSQALVEAPDDEVAQCYATRGYAYLCKGDYDRAAEDCQLAVEHDPTDAEAYAWRGSAHAGRRQWRAALEDYVEALRLDPSKHEEYHPVLLAHVDEAIADFTRTIQSGKANANLLTDRGYALSIKGDHERAVGDFSKALSADPSLAIAHRLRARSYLALGQFAKAVNDCTKAIKAGQSDPSVLFDRASALRQFGRLDQAVADFTQVIKRNPYFAPAFYERGLAQQARGAVEAALGDFSKAIKLDAGQPEYFLARAKAHCERYDFVSTADDYTAALQLLPGDVETLLARGEAHLELNQLDQAQADFDAVLAQDAVNARAYRGRGEAAAARGEPQAALTELTKALRLDPRYGDASESRGDVYLELEDYDKAIADYSRAIELQQNDDRLASLYSRRGVAYLDRQQYEEAVCDFAVAVEKNPLDADSHAWRGSAQAQLGRHREAIEDVRRALELAPERAEEYENVGRPASEAAVEQLTERIDAGQGDAAAWHDRAMALEFLGQGKEALRDYNEAIKLAPDQAGYYVRRGTILARGAKYERAAADFDKAIGLGDARPLCFHHRGVCHFKLNNIQAAKEDFDKALADPSQAEPRFYRDRGDLFAAAKQWKAAEADYTRCLKLDPRDVAGLINRGILYGKQQQYSKAARDFSAALHHDPENAAAHHHRGEALANLGRLAQAVADFEQAIDLDPNLAAAYCSRGVAMAKGGSFEQAIIELTKACGRIRFDLAFAAAFDARARVFYSMGQFHRAIVDYSFCVQLKAPGHDLSQVLYSRGLAELQVEDHERAARSFKLAKQLNPNHEDAKQALAWLKNVRQSPPPGLKPVDNLVGLHKPPVASSPVAMGQQSEEWNVEAIWDQWLVHNDQGREYGPVNKKELDRWCSEGRFGPETMLLRIDWDEWVYATDVYVELTFESARSTNRPIPVSNLEAAGYEVVDQPVNVEFVAPKESELEAAEPENPDVQVFPQIEF